MCTKSVCATNLEPFEEIGANFSLQLSSRTWFDITNKKKVIAENQCEKHKKSSLALTINHSLIKWAWDSTLIYSLYQFKHVFWVLTHMQGFL